MQPLLSGRHPSKLRLCKLCMALSCIRRHRAPCTCTSTLHLQASCTSEQALSQLWLQGEDQQRLLHLLSPEGSNDHRTWHQQSRCVLELLREFPNVHPPLGASCPLQVCARSTLPAQPASGVCRATAHRGGCAGLLARICSAVPADPAPEHTLQAAWRWTHLHACAHAAYLNAGLQSVTRLLNVSKLSLTAPSHSTLSWRCSA